jgi:hypothetical protein
VVNIYKNFEVKLAVYEIYKEKVTPYLDMKIVQHVDSTGNRMRLDVGCTIPKLGKRSISKVLNYTSKLSWVWFEEDKKCRKSDIEYEVVLNEIFNKFMDKKYGVLTYRGEENLPWDTNKYLAFDMNLQREELKDFEGSLYFNDNTKDLKWFVNKNHPKAMEVLEGIQEK